MSSARHAHAASLMVLAIALLAIACASGSPQPRPALTPGDAAAEHPPPARLRRLSNAEYASTASALVGLPVALPASFPPDVRVGGYSANGAQGVDALYLSELRKLSRALAARAVRERLGALAPCDHAQPACAVQVVERLAVRAYRRPLEPRELEALGSLFAAGRRRGGFAGGLERVLGTLLSAPDLLYLREVGVEVGEPAQPGLRRLSSVETASVLAYSLTGGPPDGALLQSGLSGALRDPAERERQALRLLARSDTRFHFRRFVREWLGLDALAFSSRPVPNDRELRRGLLAETDAFVDEVLMFEGASLDRLLLAGFTVLPASLRAFEGLPPASDPGEYGRVPLAGSGRLGLLQQPSFLAVHSHEDETAPVLRGKVILERLLCVDLPRPSELGIVVTFPPPDPRFTTRERHRAHTRDVQCISCHRSIDGIGYAFENFDFVGRARSVENGKNIETRVDYSGPGGPRSFADSRDVSRWLAEMPRAHECFARQAFRYFGGHDDAGAEAAFLAIRERLPPGERRDLFRMLVAFARSSLFVERRDEPILPDASTTGRGS